MPTKADNDETPTRARKRPATSPEPEPTATEATPEPEPVEEPQVESPPDEPVIEVATLLANAAAFTGHPSHVVAGGLRAVGNHGEPISARAATEACDAFLSHREQKPKE